MRKGFRVKNDSRIYLFLIAGTQIFIFLQYVNATYDLLNLFRMDVKDIVIYIALGVFAGFSIYRKYIRKNTAGKSESNSNYPGKSITDDDYEPYSDKED